MRRRQPSRDVIFLLIFSNKTMATVLKSRVLRTLARIQPGSEFKISFEDAILEDYYKNLNLMNRNDVIIRVFFLWF